MAQIMNINGREIGAGHPPYVIAEISCNHGGSLRRALELIDAARGCGADAVKFQAYTADTITIDCDRPEFWIEEGTWAGKNLHDLYLAAQTPFEWFAEIKARAERVGIAWFASVFDNTAVDLMVKLDAPALKIASFEIIDIPLIRYAAATGKPLILSTGMASQEEIQTAIFNAYDAGGKDPALLHCISAYPTRPADARLDHMLYLQREMTTAAAVGISDHSTGPEIPIAATALGAAIIEKHFRLSFHPDTADAMVSLDEIDFAMMVRNVRFTWAAMQPSANDSEAGQRPLRRSLFAVADIRAGEVFTAANVRSIRPGHGLPPVMIDAIIGRCATRDILRGEPMTDEMIG